MYNLVLFGLNKLFIFGCFLSSHNKVYSSLLFKIFEARTKKGFLTKFDTSLFCCLYIRRSGAYGASNMMCNKHNLERHAVQYELGLSKVTRTILHQNLFTCRLIRQILDLLMLNVINISVIISILLCEEFMFLATKVIDIFIYFTLRLCIQTFRNSRTVVKFVD